MVGTLADRLSRRAEYAVLALVLVFAAAVRLWSFVGVARLDSFRYMEVSHHVLSGGSLFDPNVFFASSRLSVFGPLLMLNALFGYGQHVSTAWPLACALLAVLAVWVIGRELYSAPVGLLAALVLACMPLNIELATQLLPDPVMTGMVVVSVALAVLAVKRDRGWLAYAIGAGVALGLAYFARINALVFLPGLLAVGAILEPKKWKRSLWALVGLGGVLAVGAVVFWVLSGDPFIDWHRAAAVVAPQVETGFNPTGEPWWRQFITPGLFTPALAMLAVGTIWALIDRRRPTWLMLAWVYGFYVYLEFLSPLHGMGTSYRYGEPLMAPIAILFACAVIWFAEKFPERIAWATVAIVSVCLIVVLVPVGHKVAHKRATAARWTAFRTATYAMLRGGESIPIVVDDNYGTVAVNFYAEYSLGRDTLMPLDATVNSGARLWTNEEQPFVSGQRVYWVSQSDPQTSDPWQMLGSYNFPGRPLRLYIVNPDPVGGP